MVNSPSVILSLYRNFIDGVWCGGALNTIYKFLYQIHPRSGVVLDVPFLEMHVSAYSTKFLIFAPRTPGRFDIVLHVSTRKLTG